jgi:thermostable 8-oxoguanine DNA glycosylase
LNSSDGIKFDLSPVEKKSRKRLDFTLKPVKEPKQDEKTVPGSSLPLEKALILKWSIQYDHDHPWWVNEETRLSTLLHKEREFGLDYLKQIVEWKFKEIHGRRKRILNLISENDEDDVKRISRLALANTTTEKAIESLRKIKGVGVSLASVILTFYNPRDYCVFDIHVWRELYGKEPKAIFTLDKYYLHLLDGLRIESRRLELPVRTIEKALFKKNLEETKGRSRNAK